MEAKGYITIGPKTAFTSGIAIFYIPTPEQIKNLREMLGWDFISVEEYQNYAKEYYGG